MAAVVVGEDAGGDAVADECRRLADRLLMENDVLLAKLQSALDCDEEVARRALVEVLRFLHLVSGSTDVLTPAWRVDLAWHELILFTRTYHAFCMECFGRFIHHTPGGTTEENGRQFARTLRLYRRRWGVPPPYFWSQHGNQLANCGGCESGTRE